MKKISIVEVLIENYKTEMAAYIYLQFDNMLKKNPDLISGQHMENPDFAMLKIC